MPVFQNLGFFGKRIKFQQAFLIKKMDQAADMLAFLKLNVCFSIWNNSPCTCLFFFFGANEKGNFLQYKMKNFNGPDVKVLFLWIMVLQTNFLDIF